jgi:UDP-N-acetylmuramoylalanine--D-glutamate ligase
MEFQKIAILGTGREGRAAWRYLRGLFPDQALTLCSETPTGDDFLRQLTTHDRLVTAPLDGAFLRDFELLIRSPGVSLYRPELQLAAAAGVRITSPSNLWFAVHPGAKTICITGTKGKSTTSALLAHVLRASGQRVQLAGNIGLPLLDCPDRHRDWWVIELSSHQTADLEARPTISVILNLSPEHLDWHGSEEIYLEDKLRLAGLAGNAPLIVNAADAVLSARFEGRGGITWFNEPQGLRVSGDGIVDGERALPLIMPSALPGRHNLSNAAAVLAVSKLIGLELDAAARAVKGFRGLPHRLQPAGELGGVRYINDSISSTPVATAAALESLHGHDVTLIIGGLDRGLDWTPYTKVFADHAPRAVIAIPDNGPAIVEVLKQAGIAPDMGLHSTDGLDAAVALAGQLTRPGGVVLLSPGAPSFPQFSDFRDRGRQFTRLCGFEPEEWDAW